MDFLEDRPRNLKGSVDRPAQKAEQHRDIRQFHVHPPFRICVRGDSNKVSQPPEAYRRKLDHLLCRQHQFRRRLGRHFYFSTHWGPLQQAPNPVRCCCRGQCTGNSSSDSAGPKSRPSAAHRGPTSRKSSEKLPVRWPGSHCKPLCHFLVDHLRHGTLYSGTDAL